MSRLPTICDSARVKRSASFSGLSWVARLLNLNICSSKVPLHVERFYGNVGALESALQQTPEVLHTVHVDIPIDVSFHLVHEVVDELVAQIVVARSSSV